MVDVLAHHNFVLRGPKTCAHTSEEASMQQYVCKHKYAKLGGKNCRGVDEKDAAQ